MTLQSHMPAFIADESRQEYATRKINESRKYWSASTGLPFTWANLLRTFRMLGEAYDAGHRQ